MARLLDLDDETFESPDPIGFRIFFVDFDMHAWFDIEDLASVVVVEMFESVEIH